jgi:hypothetical protein
MSKFIKTYPLPLAFIALISMIALSLGLADKDSFQIYFCNSDTMYLPSIYRDLVLENGDFHQWSFNASPNLYPDFLIFSGLMSVLNDTVTTIIFFGIFQYLLFVFLTGNIVHTAVKTLSLDQKALGILLAGVPFLAVVVNDDVEFVFQLLSNSFHLGASLSTLIAIRIFIQIFNKNQWWWWLPFLVHATLAGTNDKLFWIQCLIPLFGIATLLIFQKKIKIAIPLFVTIIAAFIMANMYINYHKEPAYPTIERAFREFAFSYTKDSAVQFWKDFKMMFNLFNVKSAFYIVAIGFMLISVLLILKNKLQIQKSNHLILFFFASSTFLSIIAPILNGSYMSHQHNRYFIGALLLSFLICSFILISKLNADKFTRVFSTTISVIAIGFFALNFSSFNEKMNLYPTFAKEVDTLIEKHQLKQGASTYWNSKSHEYLCKNDIRIVAVFPDVFPYLHANSRAWYFDEKDYFNFVMIDSDEHLKQLQSIFPSGTQVVQEGDTRILLTPRFRFDSNTAKMVIVGDL